MERIKNQFAWDKKSYKNGLYLREMNFMDSGTTINLFGNTRMTPNRKETDIIMKFYDQFRVINSRRGRRNSWIRTEKIPSRDDIKCSDSE